MGTKLTKTNLSVEKTMRLIEIMASHNEPMKLQYISEEANIPASTALRMLNTLLGMGYVNQNPHTLRYSLSLKFTYIGERVKQQVNITQTVHPYLIDLTNSIGECSCLAVEDGGEILYLDSFASQKSNILTTTQRIGKRAPMHCTGIGKLLLTNYSISELAAYAQNTKLLPYTPNTLTSLAQISAELNKIKNLGYAIDNEECDQGAKCIAAPIYDYTGKIIAGISITAPSFRLRQDSIDIIIPVITDTARRISASLGYQGGQRTLPIV